MAQVNNTNNTGNKIQHTWSFKSVAKKDLNMNQWPFKVVRDEGKPSKMEARSITDLNKSFDGTVYNLTDCPKVKSRYTLLYEIFKNRYVQYISKITHLLITFDSVYFITSDDSNVRGGMYANDVLKSDDLNGLMSSLLYKTGYLENNIKTAFQGYKQSQGQDEYRNQLVKEVQVYLNMRKKIRVMDTTKPMVDVLKSELNFTSLQYLIFVPYPNMAKDYQNTVIEGFMRNNIVVNNNPELVSEIKKLPTLNGEIGGLQTFISSLEKKEFHRTIRKVYLLKPSEPISVESIKKLFLNVTNSSFTNGLQYISDAEKARMTARSQEITKKTEDEKKALNETDAVQRQQQKLTNIYAEFGKSLTIITALTDMMTETLELYKAGEDKNNSEFDAWIKNYKPSKMKARIDEVFHRKYNKTDAEIPLKNILKELANNAPEGFLANYNLDEILFNELLETFDDLVIPTYFKNDKHTFKSIGCDLTTNEGIAKTEQILKKINSELTTLFEATLGNQLATFGTFMKRYGVAGVTIAKIIVSNLVDLYKDKVFVLTENVKECANAASYLLDTGKSTLEEYAPGLVKVNDTIESNLNVASDFVMKYVNELFDNIKSKTHSDGDSEKEKEERKLQNLFEVYECVYDIINQCEDLIMKEHNRGKLVEKLQTGIRKLFK